MVVLDWQTFILSWWLKAPTPDAYRNTLPFGAELHRQFHSIDALYRLWWDNLLEACAIWLYRPDIKLKFIAKEHNNREKFVRLVAVAVMQWLLQCGVPDELLQQPMKLLDLVRPNTPVFEIVGFLFLGGVFTVANKEAMRTADVSALD